MASTLRSHGRSLSGFILGLFAFTLLICGPYAQSAHAEAKELRIAFQPGLSYLPLLVMKSENFLEKQAAAQGLGDVKAVWTQFSAGPPMNDALLAGQLDLASGGITSFLILWDKTKGKLDVNAVCALNAAPINLNTSNPKIKSIADYAEGDKIALPAVKVSTNAIILQMAAEKAFGESERFRLDKYSVAMSNPDGYTALAGGKSGIDSHMVAPPFCFSETSLPGVRTILRSYDVLGGPGTINVFWTTSKFYKENPKLTKVFLSALEDSMNLIKNDPQKAAAIYMASEKSPSPEADVISWITNPDIKYSPTPEYTKRFHDFMFRIGSVKTGAASWKDYFFPIAHSMPGS